MRILLFFLLLCCFDSYSQTAERYFKSGYEQYEHKEYSKAILALDSAIDLNPAYAKAFFYRFASKNSAGDSLGAKMDLSKAIELDKKLVTIEMDHLLTEQYFGVGLESFTNNDFQRAIMYLNKAIELDKSTGDIYYYRGAAKAALDDNRGAILDFSLAIKLQPKIASYYSGRGFAKGKLKDNKGAIEDMSKAIVLNPKLGSAYYYRGIIKIVTGQKNSGCLDLSKAGELGENVYDVIKKNCQ